MCSTACPIRHPMGRKELPPQCRLQDRLKDVAMRFRARRRPDPNGTAERVDVRRCEEGDERRSWPEAIIWRS